MKLNYKPMTYRKPYRNEIQIKMCQCSLISTPLNQSPWKTNQKPKKQMHILNPSIQLPQAKRYFGKKSLANVNKQLKKNNSQTVSQTVFAMSKYHEQFNQSVEKMQNTTMASKGFHSFQKSYRTVEQASQPAPQNRVNLVTSGFQNTNQTVQNHNRNKSHTQTKIFGNKIYASPFKTLNKTRLNTEANQCNTPSQQKSSFKKKLKIKSTNLLARFMESPMKSNDNGEQAISMASSPNKITQMFPKTIESEFESDHSNDEVSVQYSIVMRESPKKMLRRLVSRDTNSQPYLTE